MGVTERKRKAILDELMEQSLRIMKGKSLTGKEKFAVNPEREDARIMRRMNRIKL